MLAYPLVDDCWVKFRSKCLYAHALKYRLLLILHKTNFTNRRFKTCINVANHVFLKYAASLNSHILYLRLCYKHPLHNNCFKIHPVIICLNIALTFGTKNLFYYKITNTII